MRSLEAAAKSDRGRMRARNEDAYHEGESVFAVADGMGGHLAGDVASATALMPVKHLDGIVYGDANSAHAALLDAILAANAAVVRKAANEPDLYGMGTTLTATIVEGRRLHVGHVGDSRAYLVRDGKVTQLTRDHTLVAHLIEEGQITKEEAARHPQRSVVTRAIGVDVDLEVDTLTIDLEDGDQVMLCSDGLTGPVGDEDILSILAADLTAEEAVQRLIDLANANGGPDNITVVLLRFHDDDGSERSSPATLIRPDAGEDRSAQDWATALGRLGSMGRTSDGARASDDDRKSGRGTRVVTVLIAVIVLLTLAVLGGRGLLSRSYFVGTEGEPDSPTERVVIYHGVPAEVGPVELYWVGEITDLEVDEVAQRWKVGDLREGIAAHDLLDARQIVDSLRPAEDEDPEPTDDATDDPTDAATAPSPGTSPTP